VSLTRQALSYADIILTQLQICWNSLWYLSTYTSLLRPAVFIGGTAILLGIDKVWVLP